jgi:hypothetical protein
MVNEIPVDSTVAIDEGMDIHETKGEHDACDDRIDSSRGGSGESDQAISIDECGTAGRGSPFGKRQLVKNHYGS